jgi:hypothetical protein
MTVPNASTDTGRRLTCQDIKRTSSLKNEEYKNAKPTRCRTRPASMTVQNEGMDGLRDQALAA